MKVYLKSLLTPFVIGSIAIACESPYQNSNLSAEERAEDLLSRLTLEEKVSLMMDNSKPIERLGVKKYNWWNEALHGAARSGLATVYPQTIGMAASFDDEAIYHVFSAISDEARAKHHHYDSLGEHERYQGLTFWTPNINIFRDPRWGRGQETYGEDPYLTSRMGVAVVEGLQGPSGGRYNKTHACAKHYTVHSGPEWNRHSFNAQDISPRDLYETYLPAFEALVKEADVKEVMCAYNRYEGEPCCGSNRLLTQILRDEWGFQGIVVSDCSAITDFFKEGAHQTHKSATDASADAVINGTDLECGSNYKNLTEAVKKGFIKEEKIDVSVKRLLKARFELGEMDDNSKVDWAKIPYSVVASAKHDSLALDIARKSMVLLTNENQILPLKKEGLTVAVMGPNAADSVMLWANYNGTPRRTITILEGIASKLGANESLIYEKGCDYVSRDLFESIFDQCSLEGKQGFKASYWNQLNNKGEQAASNQLTVPFQFCTLGATVFAPGVNLTGFSAKYETILTPKQNDEVQLNFYANGEIKLYIGGDSIKTYVSNHGARHFQYTMKVEAGKSYPIAIVFNQKNGDAQLNFDLGICKKCNIAASIERVKNADVVVFAGGISPRLEGEEMKVNFPGFKGGDRTDIELPAVQRELIAALKAAGKKVVFVNCSGSAIAMEKEKKSCDAILQAWYGGQEGGMAVADVLFGDYNPAGRLPITFYKNTAQLPDFEDYNMNGRTYRYLKTEPLFPFGYGLSYSEFKYDDAHLSNTEINVGDSLTITVPVHNMSNLDGDEVVQLYIKKLDDVYGANKTLRAYHRVSIKGNDKRDVTFALGVNDFKFYNEVNAQMETTSGTYRLFYGKSSADNDLKFVDITLK